MKILFISTTYPTPNRPRQGAFNKVLVDSLRHRNEVEVVAPVPWTQWRETRSQARVDVHARHPLYFYFPKLLRAQYGSMYWQSIRRTVQQVGRDFQPDVVLGYFLHPDGFAAVNAARSLGTASVVMSGGTDLRIMARTASRKMSICDTMQRADRVIVVSRELAERAMLMGIPPAKVDVIYRGIDRVCFQSLSRQSARSECHVPSDAVVLLWVGRFEPVKNPAMLLIAAQRWKSRWSQRLKIKMIGDGTLKRELLQLSRKLELGDVLEILPPMSQRQLAQYYNAADLTVLTSRSEGIPNVLLESISCRTPFVATSVGGVAEIATPGLDHLVASGDTDSLAAAVIECIDHPSDHPRSFVPYDNLSMAAAVEQVLQRATHARAAQLGGSSADAA